MTKSNEDSPEEPWRLSPSEKEEMHRSSKSADEAAKRIDAWELKLKRAWELTHNPALLRAELEPLVASLKGMANADGIEFEKAEGNLHQFIVTINHTSKWRFPSEVGNYLADELMALYPIRRHRSGTLRGLSLIGRIVRYGDSPAVGKFLAEILNDKDPQYRQAAIGALNGKDFPDKDGGLFDRILKIYQEEKNSNFEALVTLWRLNRERALPVLLGAAESADDPMHFIRLSKVICSYNQPALISSLMRGLKRLPPEKTNYFFHAHGRGISRDLLIQFIEANDGELLETALGVLEADPAAFSIAYQCLLGKLGSGFPSCRILTLRLLKLGFELNRFGDAQAISRIEELISREHDLGVVATAKEALAALRRKLKLNDGSA